MKRRTFLATSAALAAQQPGGREPLSTGLGIRPAGARHTLGQFPMAAVLTPDKQHVLILHAASGAASIASYDAASMRPISTVPLDGAWLGIAVHPGGRMVYVSNGLRFAVQELSLTQDGRFTRSRSFPLATAESRPNDFAGDVAISPDGRLVYVADIFHNAIRVINPQSGRVIETFPTVRRPYRILFHPDGRTFFVSSWTEGSIAQYDAGTGRLENRVIVGPHATDMVWRERKSAEEQGQSAQFRARIFASSSNTNIVRIIGVNDSKQMQQLEAVNVALYADSPAGMTPSALALSEDQDRLFVACSDANAVAVVNIADERPRVVGFIPTGAYPTAVRALPLDRLLTTSARGYATVATQVSQSDFLDWTRTVRDLVPYTEQKKYIAHDQTSFVIPNHESVKSPVEHVVYIVRDAPEQGPRRAPNEQKLGMEFVQLRNFYANGDTTVDGLFWSIAGIAPDFVQRFRHSIPPSRFNTLGLDGGDLIATPPAGYLWNNAIAKSLRVRNYGFFVANKPLADVRDGNHVASLYDGALATLTANTYRGADPAYSDMDRARALIADILALEAERRFPHLALVRLGDSDAALGQIVEALTRTTYWPKMAIFIVNAAPAGKTTDEFDSHRAPAFVVSPFVKRGHVDHTVYNSTSVLRTVELILAIRPMTMFDAGAVPMLDSFGWAPDAKPFAAEKPPN